MAIFVAPRTVPPRIEAKASPIGPGAAPLLTEFPLAMSGYSDRSPQKRMRRAWNLSFEVPWIALAEEAISSRFGNVDWHLEDEQDEEITDASEPDARSALMLLQKPSANLDVGSPFYRSDLWALTGRVMGVCGSAFIFLDQTEMLGGTPAAMLPIAPWRMWPQEDQKGNLIGWWVDRTDKDPGIALRLDQILHYQLKRTFEGHFGVGLMESAMLKLQLSQAIDQHLAMVLSAGGRLSGIMSPKTGSLEPDQMLQMERDWRTVVEQSDAAKRLQLIRAPIEFQKTTLTPQELQVRDLMDGARDDLLTLWQVPITIVGGKGEGGLNSGESRKYDEAAIWQGPVHTRLNIFREVTQYQLLDRWQALGTTIELEIDEPEFDDDSPRYDLLGKSLNTPMTDDERRALIGLPPLPGGLGNIVRLPAQIMEAFTVPIEGQAPIVTPTAMPTVAPTMSPEMLAAGETSAPVQKAAPPNRLHQSLVRLRTSLQARMTPRLRTSVGGILDEQRADVAARLRRNADHVRAKPADHSAWWDGGRWDTRLRQALGGNIAALAEQVASHINESVPAKAEPIDAAMRALTRGAARVTNINLATRDAIAAYVAAGIEAGLSPAELADAIESGTADVLMANGQSAFDELRAETIARTELTDAYNGAALASYGDAGITEVQAIDGDGDEECAARDGQTFSIEEADSIEDHPNGTLDWVPVFEEPSMAKAILALAGRQPIVNVTLPEQKAPQVTVYSPDITVQPAQVSVEPAQVTVQAPPPAQVTVDTTGLGQTVADALSKPRIAIRDGDGKIIGSKVE